MTDKYTFRKDDDGHLYLIPWRRRDDFIAELAKAQGSDDYMEFSEKFEQYRKDGGVESWSFTNPTEDS